MSSRYLRTAVGALFVSGSVCAQFQPGSCVDEPDQGPGFASRAISMVNEVDGAFRYQWRVELLPNATRTAFMLAIVAPDLALQTPAGWRAISSNPGLEMPTPVTVASIADGSTDTLDLSPRHAAEFHASSGRLPGVGLLRIYPRRPTPCFPANDEERIALEKKGWTREKITKSLSTLTLVDFYTVRDIVIVPVFVVGAVPLSSEALFAAALKDVGTLEDYLAAPLDPGVEVLSVPSPSREVPTTTLSLDTLREQAMMRKTFREGDRGIIDKLYQFYAGYTPPKTASTSLPR